jgi:hypothetical protein
MLFVFHEFAARVCIRMGSKICASARFCGFQTIVQQLSGRIAPAPLLKKARTDYYTQIHRILNPFPVMLSTTHVLADVTLSGSVNV